MSNPLRVAAMSMDRSEFKLEPSKLPLGSIVPSVEALHWTQKSDCDIRPRLVDKSTGQARLIDSGSMISVTTRRPEDKVDQSIRLIAVNGSQIEAYGVRNIEYKINRKAYKMPAVVCDVKQDILGMDFIDKFKIGFEWDDYDQTEYFLVDKKADIKAKLQIVTVPTDITRVHYLEQSSESPGGHGVGQEGPEVPAEVFCPRLDNQTV